MASEPVLNCIRVFSSGIVSSLRVFHVRAQDYDVYDLMKPSTDLATYFESETTWLRPCTERSHWLLPFCPGSSEVLSPTDATVPVTGLHTGWRKLNRVAGGPQPPPPTLMTLLARIALSAVLNRFPDMVRCQQANSP